MYEFALPAPHALLQRRRFALLLSALVALVVIAPVFGSDPQGETDVAILFSLVILGLAATSARAFVVSGLAVLWIAITWMAPFGAGASELAGDIVLLLICGFAAESALRKALCSGKVGAEELCAAVSVYLLMAVAWASIYSVLHALDPAAFSIKASDPAQSWNELLYFSFVTVTTLGYGDILPVSALARAWASVQAVCGTVYLSILIAHLVGNFSANVKAKE